MSRTHQAHLFIPERAPCAHRLHFAIDSSICNCADCGQILPLYISGVALPENVVVEALKDGLIVTWPMGGVGVADA